MEYITIPINLLPIPKTLFDFTWALIGWEFGKAFSQFDEELISKTPQKYRRILYRILHFIHHYWIGLLMVVYAQAFLTDPTAVTGWNGLYRAILWFGYGLVMEDGHHHLFKWIANKIKGLAIHLRWRIVERGY